MELNRKNVAITGVSSGIGLELLKLLLQNGCRVAACALRVDEIGIDHENLFLMPCDLSGQEGVDAFFAFAEEKLGEIDLYISNAGFAYYEKIGEPDWGHAERILRTNFVSTVYAAEKMKKAHGSRPYCFVVTASAMGLLSLPGYALYSGTKAAVRGFADAYRCELEKGQHFGVVYPIATRTNFFRSAGEGTPVPWPTQKPETVARRVIRGIRRNRKNIYPSTTFRVTGILNRVLPFLFGIYVGINRRAFRKWLKTRDGEV